MSDKIEGITYGSRADISYDFKGAKKVAFKSMRTPRFEVRNKQIVDIMYLCCIYQTDDGAHLQVNLDATADVKRRLMSEQVSPWSVAGVDLAPILTFNSQGIVCDYELQYNSPEKLTNYNFELVEDDQNPYNKSGVSSVVNSPDNTIVFKLLPKPTATAAVYVSKLDTNSAYSGNEKDIAILLNKCLLSRNKNKISEGFVLDDKYVVMEVDKGQGTYTVNLIPLV